MSKADIVIRGKTYSIACAEGQEARLVALGEKFNARIKALEETIGDVGDGRLLIAAGLSLVDDLEAAQSMMDKHEIDDLDNRITLIERTAAAALSDAAVRINAISSRIDEAG